MDNNTDPENISLSSPDLSCEGNFVNNDQRLRKRKFREDEYSSSMLLTRFDSFAKDITMKLGEIKNDLESKISNTHEEIKNTLKCDLDSIKCNLKSIEDKQNSLLSNHADLVQRVDVIEIDSKTNNQEVRILKEQVLSLQSQINLQQQRDRIQNLEISGIPEKNNEQLNNILIAIANVAGLNLSDQDIEFVTRVQPRTKIPGRPKLIIAKMKSRLIRDSIISGVRAKKGLTTTDINFLGESKKIYVNEHLTPANKLLYKNTRQKASALKYQFTWIRDGKIFVRKDDTSPYILVKDMPDLDKLI